MAISGQNFDITIGGYAVHVETATLDIEDASTVAKTQGIPNGTASGEVSGSGEIVVDVSNFNVINEAAGRAGSWRELEDFDMLFYAKDSRAEEMRVEAFGCRLRIGSLLNIDSKGGEKSTVTLPYDVTSPDFVKINGVPYLASGDTSGLF